MCFQQFTKIYDRAECQSWFIILTWCNKIDINIRKMRIYWNNSNQPGGRGSWMWRPGRRARRVPRGSSCATPPPSGRRQTAPSFPLELEVSWFKFTLLIQICQLVYMIWIPISRWAESWLGYLAGVLGDVDGPAVLRGALDVAPGWLAHVQEVGAQPPDGKLAGES